MQAESVEAAVRRHAHRTLDEQRRDIKALVAASRLRIARTQALVLASLVVAAGLLLLVALSPLFLVELDERNEADWSRLSEIGQTYGAASALLSGLALAGVAASLILQARQASTDRMYAIRSMHLELVRMGLDDPRLLGLDPDAPETNDGRRERYLALWLNQARMAYQVGITPEASLRMEVLGDAIFARAPVM